MVRDGDDLLIEGGGRANGLVHDDRFLSPLYGRFEVHRPSIGAN